MKIEPMRSAVVKGGGSLDGLRADFVLARPLSAEEWGDGARTSSLIYYFIDFEETEVAADQAYSHAQFRRTIDDPTSDFTLLDGVRGRGQYVGIYLAWGVHNTGWWGEGEVKFFVDDDDAFPAVCCRSGQTGVSHLKFRNAPRDPIEATRLGCLRVSR